ncbi:MAG: hypothetical protein DMG17_30860, partial [Acidobacteria bacterium]
TIDIIHQTGFRRDHVLQQEKNHRKHSQLLSNLSKAKVLVAFSCYFWMYQVPMLILITAFDA